MDYLEVDLEGFGYEEIKEMSKLLKDYVNNKVTLNFDRNFSGTPIKVGFNLNSGNVFLIDDNYTVAMGSPLDIFLSLPYSGEEGFPGDFEGKDIAEFSSDDVEYLKKFGTFNEKGNFKENKFKTDELIRCKFISEYGTSHDAKWIDLNSESLPKIIEFLKKLQTLKGAD